MISIGKAVLKPIPYQVIQIPRGAEILSAREWRDQVCIWYRGNPKAAKEDREIAVIGVEVPCPSRKDPYRLIGIVSLYGEQLFFHVFEKMKPKKLKLKPRKSKTKKGTKS